MSASLGTRSSSMFRVMRSHVVILVILHHLKARNADRLEREVVRGTNAHFGGGDGRAKMANSFSHAAIMGPIGSLPSR